MNLTIPKDPKIRLAIIGIAIVLLAIPATFYMLWGRAGLVALVVLPLAFMLMYEIPLTFAAFAVVLWSWIPGRLKNWTKAKVGLTE